MEATVSEEFEIDLNLGRSLTQGLVAGNLVSDVFFNQLLTPSSRRLTGRHWTPIAVAKRAAQLLTQGAPCTVLDVGSGVGKFCMVGALTTTAHFFGVERRETLVNEARRLCEALSIPRADFTCANVVDIDWGKYDAIYLFNPFLENIDPTAQIDSHFEFTLENYLHFTRTTKDKLREAKPGTRVVTFHGFGSGFPPEYVLKTLEPWGTDFLELWEKVAPTVVTL